MRKARVWTGKEYPLSLGWWSLVLSGCGTAAVAAGQRRGGRRARRAAQVHRLEMVQAKQAAVLRRKTEEADAARRRLKARPVARFRGRRSTLAPA